MSRIDALLAARPLEHVLTSKVKGHATRSDVARGYVLEVDKLGNDKAVALAVCAAMSHSAPAGILERAARRKRQARAVHHMILNILTERSKEESNILADAEEILMYDDLFADVDVLPAAIPGDPG